MNRRAGSRLCRSGALALSMIVVVPAGLAVVRADEERVRPSYARGKAQRPRAPRPATPSLPDALVLEVEQDVKASRGALRTRPGSGDAPRTPPAAPPDPSDRQGWLDEQAALAAHWAAAETIRTVGSVEYYRIGFHRGFRRAMNDDSLGSWDYLQGVRLGGLDPQAHRTGLRAGHRAARELAEVAAEQRVAEQFTDLARTPRYAPRFDPPLWEPAPHWAVEPTLGEVFDQLPLSGYAGADRLLLVAFERWSWSPQRLSTCESYTEFHDANWRDASRGLELWRRAAHGGRWLGRLPVEQRRLFEQRFRDEFAWALTHGFERQLQRAYRGGFDDGWGYGGQVAFEWNFRRGYAEGFDGAASVAAAVSFEQSYHEEYEWFYDASFRDWSTNPKPAIRAAWLRDGNDDGIFQPGEPLLVDYELVNFGGAAGSVELRLAGRVLEGGEPVRVELPARDTTASRQPVTARVRASTPVRTAARVELQLEDQVESLSLWVSHPLEFAGGVALDSDNLGGRAVVSIPVVNRSRRAIPVEVALERVSGYDITDRQDLGTLAPGGQREAIFELSGLRTIDMLAGDIELRLSVAGDGETQDARSYEFPDFAADLHNRDLLRYMIELSRDPGASARDVEAVRGLVLRRLRADWTAAVRASGNPYKQDFKQRGSRTALGDLVRTYERQRSTLARSEVFTGLDAEVLALAEELPGAHPFLRKFMKRLARRLG